MRKLFSIMFWTVLLLIGSAQVTWAQHTKVYDLGPYPGGTYVVANDINNADVVAGYGDAADGYMHAFGVSLHGPNAMQWFDLGNLGGVFAPWGVKAQALGIADNGMIVGLAAIVHTPYYDPDSGYTFEDFWWHAFAWTPKSGMVDIGTLESLGEFSTALGGNVNKAGTLIVGWSGNWELAPPVVWTPKVEWTKRGPTTTWNIQKLETVGYPDACCWGANSVNNLGQIVGSGGGSAWVWNPVPGRNQWKITHLPASSDYPNAHANAINEYGDIVGYVASSDLTTTLPALWKQASRSGNIWKLTVLPAPSDQPFTTQALGINNRGDIVGGSFDAITGNYLAAPLRWSTKDPHFVQNLDFPGAGSPGARGAAYAVNDNGLAVGAYSTSTINQHGFASQVPH